MNDINDTIEIYDFMFNDDGRLVVKCPNCNKDSFIDGRRGFVCYRCKTKIPKLTQQQKQEVFIKRQLILNNKQINDNEIIQEYKKNKKKG
jgi:hypothetical protein